MKKTVFILIFVLIISGMPAFLQTSSAAATAPTEITAETAILIDAKTGRILFEKNKDTLKEPASTTKIMTCLLTLENLPIDKILTIDAESPFTGGSKIFVIEGEEFTVEQLLYALMLSSANDVAVALAIAIAGSVSEFADMMNERAREMGAKRPSYKNPSGLHDPDHFASAYDLAVVAREAMRNPKFREIVSTVEYTIPATNKQPERDYIYNTNRLLYDQATRVPVKGVMRPAKYEGATGIKTGYTPQAGASLVSSAVRGDTEFIAVVLASADAARFGDSIALLDFGFENFYTHKAVDSSIPIEDVKVKRGVFNRVPVKIQEDIYITLPIEASVELIDTKIVMDDSAAAPVEAGQALGRVEIYEGSNLLGEVAVIAVSDIGEGMFLSRFGLEDSVSEKIKKYAIIIGCVLGAFVLAYIILAIRYERRRRNRRHERAMQIAMEREAKQREMEHRRWPY